MKNLVMIIRKSSVHEMLDDLMNEIIEHKLLINIVEDDDFDLMFENKNKGEKNGEDAG